MKNKFLEKVSEQIEDEVSRELITSELESHLLDKIDYYVDIDYSKEEAEKRAAEEMGNPDDTAVPLNALYNTTAVLRGGIIHDCGFRNSVFQHSVRQYIRQYHGQAFC